MWKIGPSGLGAVAWRPHRNSFKRGAEARLKTWQGPGARVYLYVRQLYQQRTQRDRVMLKGLWEPTQHDW